MRSKRGHTFKLMGIRITMANTEQLEKSQNDILRKLSSWSERMGKNGKYQF